MQKQSSALSEPSGDVDPGTQRVQLAGPVAVLYLPTSQRTHRALSSPCPVQPAVHEQFLFEVAPTNKECFPSPHERQLVAPVSFEYLPRRHSTQSPGEVAPLATRNLPLAQSRHAVAGTPASEYLPAGQSRHGRAPGTSLYVPAAHPAHDPPLGPVNARSHTQKEAAVALVE